MFPQFEIFDADGLPSGKQKFTLIDHYVNIVMGNFKYAIVDNFANLVTNQKALNEILRIRAENRQILNLDRKIGADSTFWWTNVVDVEATNFARIIAMVEVVMLGYSRHFPAEILPQKSKVSVAYDTDGKGSRYLRQFEAAANCNRCLNGLYYMKQLPATDENSAEQNAVDKQLNMKINDRLVLYWSRKTVKADSPLS